MLYCSQVSRADASQLDLKPPPGLLKTVPEEEMQDVSEEAAAPIDLDDNLSSLVDPEQLSSTPQELGQGPSGNLQEPSHTSPPEEGEGLGAEHTPSESVEGRTGTFCAP